MKIPSVPQRLGDAILLKNTYMVEFPPDVDVRNHFRKITNTLKASNQNYESEIKIRSVIRSSLFNGASFSVTTDNSIEASKVLEGAIDIRPVYLVPAPRTFKSSFSSDKSIDTDSYLINAFDLTGVAQVHKQFQNFGKGVRVGNIQSCAVLVYFFLIQKAIIENIIIHSKTRISLHSWIFIKLSITLDSRELQFVIYYPMEPELLDNIVIHLFI
jgi:hypothetical protein